MDMKNFTAKLSIFTIFALTLASCGMKDCKCYSKNVITANDSLIQVTIDTVSNSTRHKCEDFNKEETMLIDSARTITHTLLCEEE
ncbi:MAG: hypothetical protein SPL42_06585 [Bacteroidales bacterium]|nr:hypothetical protein [Bacteroidales bacterium]MDY6348079.1 hypothetical protein [Bacteroidales bacterium]